MTTDPPLPARMRLAADVLTEANKRIGTKQNSMWSPESLRYSAERWEREDAAEDQRKNQIAELAGLISRHTLNEEVGATHRDLARKLIDAGWTKGTTDDESA